MNKGNIIVIGGYYKDKIVEWAEQKGSYGLLTGFRVVEVVEDGVKINGYDGVITSENIYTWFEDNESFYAWVKEELERERTEGIMEIFEDDFTDFIME